jgi:hypothetical protein
MEAKNLNLNYFFNKMQRKINQLVKLNTPRFDEVGIKKKVNHNVNNVHKKFASSIIAEANVQSNNLRSQKDLYKKEFDFMENGFEKETEHLFPREMESLLMTFDGRPFDPDQIHKRIKISTKQIRKAMLAGLK